MHLKSTKFCVKQLTFFFYQQKLILSQVREPEFDDENAKFKLSTRLVKLLKLK